MQTIFLPFLSLFLSHWTDFWNPTYPLHEALLEQCQGREDLLPILPLFKHASHVCSLKWYLYKMFVCYYIARRKRKWKWNGWYIVVCQRFKIANCNGQILVNIGYLLCAGPCAKAENCMDYCSEKTEAWKVKEPAWRQTVIKWWTQNSVLNLWLPSPCP